MLVGLVAFSEGHRKVRGLGVMRCQVFPKSFRYESRNFLIFGFLPRCQRVVPCESSFEVRLLMSIIA